MADEASQTPPAVTQGNDTTARTETGEIRDQQATQATTQDSTAKPPEGEKRVEAAKDGEKKADGGKVPEKYELKGPEGVAIDTKAVEDATPILKELGISQDGAQKLFDFMVKRDQATSEAANKAYETTRSAWRNDIIKSDLGDGKEGLKPEVKANVARAIEAIGDPAAIKAFKEALDYTGAGDNPAVAKALNIFGKLLSEGTAVKAGSPSPGGQAAPGANARPSPAQALYPKLPSSAAT